MPVRFDLDALVRRLTGKRVAIACTPAGWVPGTGLLTDFLVGAVDVRGFLALEHGLRGELQDGVQFDSFKDPRTGRPVFSFYGDTHSFPPDFLQRDVDTVVFHAQDVSHRAYTYKLALADTLAAAAGTDTEVVVVDRPSPLAHVGHVGPLCQQFFPFPLPVLVGATLGELAQWTQSLLALEVNLDVVRVGGWKRRQDWATTGLPWIPPSPNLPTLVSAYCYACTGILQATNISEGRGTCKPFEYFGAPFVDAARLATELNARALPGVTFREVYFQPVAAKYTHTVCAGIHFMLDDVHGLLPYRTMLTILQVLARLHSDDFTLTPGFGVWLDGQPWSSGKLAELDIEAACREGEEQAADFGDRIAPFLLY